LDRLFGLLESLDRLRVCQMLEGVGVRAKTQAPIPGKFAPRPEERQARKLDGQPAPAVDGPVKRDAAPGLARGNGRRHAPFRIETECFGDLVPWPAKAGPHAYADQ